MEKLTIGDFASCLNAKMNDCGNCEIVSVNQTKNGYVIAFKNRNDETLEMLISKAEAYTEVSDAVDDEITIYSIMTNVAYMMTIANKMVQNKQIPNVSQPELIAAVIQIAEEFENENGSGMVGDDTVKVINQFVEEKIKEQFKN